MDTILKQKKHEEGFTLVELSIVLVIIGLIIGGVLAGQDMIKAAEIRAQVAQLQGFDTAANTFRDKYGYAPGDLPGNGTTASPNNFALQFGLTQRSGAAGHGDGNGLIEGCSLGARVFGCETILIWRDMNQMNLIDGAFNQATDALTAVASMVVAQGYIPEAKMKRGNMVTAFATVGRNYYGISGFTSTSSAGVYALVPALAPQEAFAIDAKMDDGKPITGIVRASYHASDVNTGVQAKTYTTNGTAATPAGSTILDCIDGDGTNAANTVYNLQTEDLTNTPSCQLRVRAGF